MEDTLLTVPEGMSCVNAFRALWERSEPANFFKIHPELAAPQEATVDTAAKVVKLFKDAPIKAFHYEGARLMMIDFTGFPLLDARSYDLNLGEGAAQAALDVYNQIPTERRFDPYDRCSFKDLRS